MRSYRAHYPDVARAYRVSKRTQRNAHNQKRRAAKKNRVPKWADLRAIADFYAACPPGYDVDHICPMQGRTVSGLHTLNNLQYLPATINSRKGNRFPGPLIGSDEEINEQLKVYFEKEMTQ